MRVIEFTPDGKAECLHAEVIPLEQLGTLSMERASSIEWNAQEQVWEVRGPMENVPFVQRAGWIVLFSDASRDACLMWERIMFNDKILNR